MNNSEIKKNTITIIVILFILSVFANVLSIELGVAWGNDGYLEKANWYLFPIFFLVVGALVYFSWSLFMEAWFNIHKHELLYINNESIEKNKSIIIPTILKLHSLRKHLILISIFLGICVTILDAGCLWSEYNIYGSSVCKERDFSLAFKMSEFTNTNELSNGLFNIYVYLLQGILIAGGLLALFQMILHTLYFLKFESTKEASKINIELKLNIDDKLHEFGVSEFNKAINIVFIFIAVAMVIPIISSLSQQQVIFDFGQILLRVLLPLVLLVPLAISFYDRILRLSEANNRVLKSTDTSAEENLAKQRIWPFDGMKMGYIGKGAACIAFTEYTYLFSDNLIKLLEKFQ